MNKGSKTVALHGSIMSTWTVCEVVNVVVVVLEESEKKFIDEFIVKK